MWGRHLAIAVNLRKSKGSQEECEAVEARLIALLTSGTFANLKTVERQAGEGQLRDRVLTLSVMSSTVDSFGFQVDGLAQKLETR